MGCSLSMSSNSRIAALNDNHSSLHEDERRKDLPSSSTPLPPLSHALTFEGTSSSSSSFSISSSSPQQRCLLNPLSTRHHSLTTTLSPSETLTTTTSSVMPLHHPLPTLSSKKKKKKQDPSSSLLHPRAIQQHSLPPLLEELNFNPLARKHHSLPYHKKDLLDLLANITPSRTFATNMKDPNNSTSSCFDSLMITKKRSVGGGAGGGVHSLSSNSHVIQSSSSSSTTQIPNRNSKPFFLSVPISNSSLLLSIRNQELNNDDFLSQDDDDPIYEDEEDERFTFNNHYSFSSLKKMLSKESSIDHSYKSAHRSSSLPCNASFIGRNVLFPSSVQMDSTTCCKSKSLSWLPSEESLGNTSQYYQIIITPPPPPPLENHSSAPPTHTRTRMIEQERKARKRLQLSKKNKLYFIQCLKKNEGL
ncbi:hypothetical protein FDP41_004309 [Naegleria fowleri]|uniref:Uncharacterized protein n=1 Tax=Naegleria fowleri TaxID=5763 RepID=A0A6A5BRG8_NAEFO|nr:uncharacterized protein FDP41_004309 [Naegleria fowleri]KAF0976410.1 hypothetical protein FDP41_004309 [Naegleria fowleri]